MNVLVLLTFYRSCVNCHVGSHELVSIDCCGQLWFLPSASAVDGVCCGLSCGRRLPLSHTVCFLAVVVAGCSVAGLVGLVVAGFCWYR